MAEMMSFTLDRQSYQQIIEKLQSLHDVEKEGIIAQALKEGATIIVQEGKQNLVQKGHNKSGKLLKSIGVLVKKKDKKVYGGFSRPEGAVAHLVDRGTKERIAYTKSGANRGKVEGSGFWTKAFETKKEEAANEVIESINQAIDNIMNR